MLKNAIKSPIDRVYRIPKPVKPSATFHVYPVYLLTLAYSKGHSTIDLHVADVIAPIMTLI